MALNFLSSRLCEQYLCKPEMPCWFYLYTRVTGNGNIFDCKSRVDTTFILLYVHFHCMQNLQTWYQSMRHGVPFITTQTYKRSFVWGRGNTTLNTNSIYV